MGIYAWRQDRVLAVLSKWLLRALKEDGEDKKMVRALIMLRRCAVSAFIEETHAE